ncbi:GGDEF domain-containing protein [Vallicoccus soli]|uniref:Sensor domain-containing diguanylate cyclase n=1 Tax=Vallicoccus soli TaxID=2339232 RepID=A0A3A3ZMG4_9ACTN|nr:GGDEF domain-containing protein [Vallicoccus soli]RJK97845.1 sensor domain-containing diguanylate cyclase [Vallicoccus soli]
MSLRNRLWLVVGALVLLPLLVGGGAAVSVVQRDVQRADQEVLDARTDAVAVALARACAEAGVAARSVGAEAAVGSPEAAVQALVESRYVDYSAVLQRGRVVAASDVPPYPGRELLSCAAGDVPPAGAGGPVIAERVEVRGDDRIDTAVAAIRPDLTDLARIGDEDVAGALLLLTPEGGLAGAHGGGDVAAALAGAAAAVEGSGAFEVDGWEAFVQRADDPVGSARSPYTVVVATEHGSLLGLGLVVAGTTVVLVLLVLFLGWNLARQLSRPLAELTEAAERVAAGDLDQTLPVRRRDETGRLALAFNRMTRELRRTVADLSRSRDDLRESLSRLGGALGSTHDLEGLLTVVLDTAVSISGAQAGAAWVDEGHGALQLVTTKGRQRDVPDRFVGGDGAELLIRATETGRIERDERQVVVPLLRMGRVVGLLGLGSDGGAPRMDDAAETALQTLAAQAGIAVDNVLVHREAQRLSITDPLTGLWNFRYLSMNLAREIERASRFDRPLAVLMMDLDHFKSVNDTYGHARGDAVLRELAARLSEQIREVDTLARYGGEEFVLVLPETTLEGAGRLAERICAAVRREPFGGEDGEVPLPVTVSVGVAGFPDHGASAATLMRAADEALYVAKHEGRDRWMLAGVREDAHAGD